MSGSYKETGEEREAVKGEEKDIHCRNCDLKLGILFITEKPDVNRKKLQFGCPCGDKSYVTGTSFKTFFIPEELLKYDKFSQEGGIHLARLVKR